MVAHSITRLGSLRDLAALGGGIFSALMSGDRWFGQIEMKHLNGEMPEAVSESLPEPNRSRRACRA